MHATLIPHRPSDLMVVNAARVSFNKKHDTLDPVKDPKLINYLASHGHWTPFAHPHFTMDIEFDSILQVHELMMSKELMAGLWVERAAFGSGDTLAYTITGSLWALMQFAQDFSCLDIFELLKIWCKESVEAYLRTHAMFHLSESGCTLLNLAPATNVYTMHIRAPIFVARQLAKHQVGMVWNEVSRRYVDDEPSYYNPLVFRGRPVDKKQGSTGESTFDFRELEDWEDSATYMYLRMTELFNVAPEQARIVLPLSTYTEWYWTGHKAAWNRVLELRLKEDTQAETREIAEYIKQELLTV